MHGDFLSPVHIWKALSIYQHCVSRWDCIVKLSGLSHRALDCKNILEGFLFLCLRIAAAMNNSDPISLCYNDLCCVIDWGYFVLMHQLQGLCFYLQIKRNIYRICQHICVVCSCLCKKEYRLERFNPAVGFV